jgi:chromosome segregation and condensation protein ScpB
MELKYILEAILFSAQKPLSPKELRDLLAAASEHGDAAKPFKKTREDAIIAALEELQRDHEAAQRSYRLACVAGAWQFVSQPQFAPWIIALVGAKARLPRLSQPALETLAIIATASPSPAPKSNKSAAWPWTASCKLSSSAGWSGRRAAPTSSAAP